MALALKGHSKGVGSDALGPENATGGLSVTCRGVPMKVARHFLRSVLGASKSPGNLAVAQFDAAFDKITALDGQCQMEALVGGGYTAKRTMPLINHAISVGRCVALFSLD